MNNIKINYLRSLISVGAPDFFHAVYPPLIWATGDKPIFWIVSVASAERWPSAQKKINFYRMQIYLCDNRCQVQPRIQAFHVAREGIGG